MRQMLLGISPDASYGFDNFVTGANGDLIKALKDAAANPDALGHCYLWGPQGCGRTHLIQACAEAARQARFAATVLDAATIHERLPDAPDQLLLVDDINRLSEDGQIALFNSFNRARDLGQTLILSGPCPPMSLHLREDLRTRVGQTLVFQVREMDDPARAKALAALAARRGLRLEPDVMNYLLRHGRRDLPSLLAVIDALDRASLEQKRPATLPLLRELMQRGLDI